MPVGAYLFYQHCLIVIIRHRSCSCSGLTFVAAANCSFLQGHPVWDIDYRGQLQARLRFQLELAGQESTNILAIALHGNKVWPHSDLCTPSIKQFSPGCFISRVPYIHAASIFTMLRS